jgi:hypothetical protein
MAASVGRKRRGKPLYRGFARINADQAAAPEPKAKSEEPEANTATLLAALKII